MKPIKVYELQYLYFAKTIYGIFSSKEWENAVFEEIQINETFCITLF